MSAMTPPTVSDTAVVRAIRPQLWLCRNTRLSAMFSASTTALMSSGVSVLCMV